MIFGENIRIIRSGLINFPPDGGFFIIMGIEIIIEGKNKELTDEEKIEKIREFAEAISTKPRRCFPAQVLYWYNSEYTINQAEPHDFTPPTSSDEKAALESETFGKI